MLNFKKVHTFIKTAQMSNFKICTTFILIVINCISTYNQNNDSYLSAGSSLLVDSVWSAHPVDFDVLTTNKNQYVVYYDCNRQMSIAKRKLTSDKWEYYKFDNYTGWDSHNYITLVNDQDGYIHVSGNMHGDKLIYYRSLKPNDISAFKRLNMTGELESEVTYPVFFKQSDGTLYFQYRDGKSGNGITLWNKYNTATKQWVRVFNGGLFDGENEANAYPYGPVPGPDGFFHLIWMWRLTPNANTNHNLSYMKSKDLIHWSNANDTSLEIPVKWSNNMAYVNQVGPWNGLINMDFYIWFDNKQKPVLTYHQYDNAGVSQIFASRFETKNWKKYQLTHWDKYAWNLNKYGSIESEVRLNKMLFNNDFIQAQYHHKLFGKGVLKLRNEDFKTLADIKNKDIVIPEFITEIPLITPKYQKNYVFDNTMDYLLLWQTLERNQDRPREKPYPAGTALKVFKMH
jgi:hypothetical protein